MDAILYVRIMSVRLIGIISGLDHIPTCHYVIWSWQGLIVDAWTHRVEVESGWCLSLGRTLIESLFKAWFSVKLLLTLLEGNFR